MANSTMDAYTRRMKAAELQSTIDATLKRISSHKGVVGYLVLNPRDGSIMKYVGMTDCDVGKYAKSVHAFVNLTRSVVRTLDASNDLMFLRLRSKKHEIIVAPEKDFVFVVVQDYHIVNKDDMVIIRPKQKEEEEEEAENEAGETQGES
eukprot:RCo055554